MWMFRKKKGADENGSEASASPKNEPETSAEDPGVISPDDEADIETTTPPDASDTTAVITPEEKAAISALKMKITEELMPGVPLDVSFDHTMLRFVRARQLDVNKAFDMYSAMIAWRKEKKVDGMLAITDPNEDIFHCHCPHRSHGFDKQGHPVYLEATGRIVVGNLLKHMSEEDVVTRHVRFMEYSVRRSIAQSQKLDRYIGKHVMIHDLSGLKYGFESSSMRIFRQTTRIDQDYYPEILHRMIIINAPLSFRAVWKIVRPWLDKRTQAKVEIYGTNFQPRLRELIEAGELPLTHGGTCTCAGKYANGDACLSPIREFGKVDQAEIPPPWPHVAFLKATDIADPVGTALDPKPVVEMADDESPKPSVESKSKDEESVDAEESRTVDEPVA